MRAEDAQATSTVKESSESRRKLRVTTPPFDERSATLTQLLQFACGKPLEGRVGLTIRKSRSELGRQGCQGAQGREDRLV
jgi:hypothetical protein